MQRKRVRFLSVALERDMEVLRNQLNQMISGDRQKLLGEDVYQLSVKLDRLIVKYMKACV